MHKDEYLRWLSIDAADLTAKGVKWRGEVVHIECDFGTSKIAYILNLTSDAGEQRKLRITTDREILAVQMRQSEIWRSINQWLLSDEPEGQIALLD